MQVNILIFGQLTDITGTKNFTVPGVATTDELMQRLHDLYPALAQSKYIIAVEKELVAGNTLLRDNDTVALLPPYAGG